MPPKNNEQELLAFSGMWEMSMDGVGDQESQSVPIAATHSSADTEETNAKNNLRLPTRTMQSDVLVINASTQLSTSHVSTKPLRHNANSYQNVQVLLPM